MGTWNRLDYFLEGIISLRSVRETVSDSQIKGRKAPGGHLSGCEISQKVAAVQQIGAAISSVSEAVRHHSLTDGLKPGRIEPDFY